MAELHKYATSGIFYVPLLLASTQNFGSTSVITFASSDVTIVKDGSTYRNLTNTPTGVAMGSKAVFKIVASASELTAKKIAIQITDESVNPAIQDQMIIIDTYGASSGQHIAFPADVTQIGGSTITFDNFEDWHDGTGITDTGINLGIMVSLTSDVGGKVVGAVASVTAAVTVGTNNDKTGYALATTAQNDLSDKFWDEPVAAHATTNQFGGLIVDNLDDNVTSRMSSTRSVLGSTENARANVIQIGGSTVTFDNFEDWHDGTGVTDTGINLGQMVSLSSDVGGKVVGAVGSVTGSVGSVAGNVDGSVDSVTDPVTVGTNNDKTGYALASTAQDDIVDKFWNEPVAGHASSSQFGGLIVTNLDGTITSRLGTTVGVQFGTTAQNFITDEINDAIFVDTSSESTGLGGSIANKISASYERMYNHHQQDSSTQVVMKSGSTSDVKFVMTVTNSSGFQTVQEATTA